MSQRGLLWARTGLLFVLLMGFFGFFLLGGHHYLTFEELNTHHVSLLEYTFENQLHSLTVFFGLYVLLSALSLPGTVILNLAAGALFGLLSGTVVVSFASSIGATLAFLSGRFLFRDGIQARLGPRLDKINKGVEKEGLFYLFTLRLVPIVPYFLVNIVMGLTPIRTRSFYWVSQVGMLPLTILYVFAGSRLAFIRSPQDILSPPLLLAFIAIGMLPLLAKKVLDGFRRRKLHGHPRSHTL